MLQPSLIHSMVNSNTHLPHHRQPVVRTPTRSTLSSHTTLSTTTLSNSTKPRWFLPTSLSPMTTISKVISNNTLRTNTSSSQQPMLSTLWPIRSGVSHCQTLLETPPLSWLKRLLTILAMVEEDIWQWRWTGSRTRFCRIINSLAASSMPSNQTSKYLSASCQHLYKWLSLSRVNLAWESEVTE